MIIYAIVSFRKISRYAFGCSSRKKPVTNIYKSAKGMKIIYGIRNLNTLRFHEIFRIKTNTEAPIKDKKALSRM